MHRDPLDTASVAIISERRYLAQTMPLAIVGPLARRGVQADVLCADECRFDPQTGVVRAANGTSHSLRAYTGVIARTRHALGLVMLSYAESHDVTTINSTAAIEDVRNKARMAVALSRAGLPSAYTVLAPDLASLATVAAGRFPLILKPTFGDNGRGLLLVRSPADLADLEWDHELILAQQYLSNDGFDLKLYVCGTRVFAVHKPSPFNGDPRAEARSVVPTAAMVDLALACGAVFGLEVYGVDTLETPDGLVVIEVNEFPNFSGLRTAPDCIADHVLARITHRREEVGHARRDVAAALGA
jgi:ribosomal protein S6--L-glutamate ligase